MTWRPIETAPRDGGYILLGGWAGYRRNDRATEGFWRAELESRTGRLRPAGWVASSDMDTPYPIDPTHWQPLPAPPEDEG